MPAPKFTGKSREYLLMQNEAGLSNESYDCTVKALALATGIPYQEARADLAQRGREDKRGVANYILQEAIKDRGFTIEWVSIASFIARYPGAHSTALQHVTTHHPLRFNKVWRDGHTYLFSCNHHVLIIRNGENLDWTKGRALHVHCIYRITKGPKS